MTDNPNRIPFKGMLCEDQDRAELEAVIKKAQDEILRIFHPTHKPAKDPNRPRPAHKLNLRDGDVVRHVGNQDGSCGYNDDIIVGDGYWGIQWMNYHIRAGHTKGQRPLFVVVSRANGGGE